MYLKKGDKWLVKNYNGYTISLLNLKIYHMKLLI